MFAVAFLLPLISYHINPEYDDDGDNHEDYGDGDAGDDGGGHDDEQDADVYRPLLLLLVS